METDKAKPSREFLLKMSEVYGISAEWLLNGRGEMIASKDAHPVPVRKIDEVKLMCCADAVDRELGKLNLTLDNRAFVEQVFWAYNELATRMTDPEDGDEMDATLPLIGLLIRRRLAQKT